MYDGDEDNHNSSMSIGSAQRPVPTTLFHVRGRNLATELSQFLCGRASRVEQFANGSTVRHARGQFTLF